MSCSVSATLTTKPVLLATATAGGAVLNKTVGAILAKLVREGRVERDSAGGCSIGGTEADTTTLGNVIAATGG